MPPARASGAAAASVACCHARALPCSRAACQTACTVKSIVVDNHQVKANFWDLAGAAEYFEVRNEFYRDAQGAMLGTLFPLLYSAHHAAPTPLARPHLPPWHPAAGAAKRASLTRADACPVFDVGNRASFEALDAWVEEAHKHGARDMHVVVCGNKCDRYTA